MDTTINGVMQEAIDYAGDISFLPLHPVDDHYDQLLVLWHRVRPRDWRRIFWENESESTTQRVFLGYMQHTTLIMLGFVDNRIACAGWLTGMYGQGKTSRCDLSGWMPFTARGVGSEHILKKALSYAHETLGIQSVFMRSPWRTVQSLCERAGLKEVAAIEQYYIRGKPETLRIFRSDANGMD